MNQDHDSKGTNFEDRLLAELRATVARREPETDPDAWRDTPSWRRPSRLALAGVVATGTAAAALIFSAGGGETSTAYAVTPQGDGKVNVKILSLSDPGGLQKALDDVGVPAEVDFEGEAPGCEPSSWQSTDAEPAQGAETVQVESIPAKPMATVAAPAAGEAASFTVAPEQVPPGKTLVVTAVPDSEGGVAGVQVKVAEGQAGACEAASAPPPTYGAAPAKPVEAAEPAEGGAAGTAQATPVR
jgi:hypothetical protein